jgi:hypothetical protein
MESLCANFVSPHIINKTGCMMERTEEQARMFAEITFSLQSLLQLHHSPIRPSPSDFLRCLEGVED